CMRALAAFREVMVWDPKLACQGSEAIRRMVIATTGVEPASWSRGSAMARDTLPISGMSAYFRQSQILCDELMASVESIPPTQGTRRIHALREAMAIARRIQDDRRWLAAARLAERTSPSGPPPDTCFPDGYFKWINTLIHAESIARFDQLLEMGLSRMTAVTQGHFLDRNDGFWQWQPGWGNSIPASIRRTIIRTLDRTAGQTGIPIGGWTLIPYPESIPRQGYLVVGLDPKRTGDIEFSEAVATLRLLIRPILAIRDGLHAFLSESQPREILPETGPTTMSPIRDAADRLLGDAPAIRSLREKIRKIAGSPSSVHVQGETGTGKELVARAIHFCGNRHHGPFIAFNCATCPESIIDSELFGHIRGAFTGAHADRRGVFASACGGTVFLDEIADLPPNSQAKLLRVIQERRVRPLGSDTEIPVDVRIISATHRSLTEEMASGRFRDDLYYRLVVITLTIAPLRDRIMDIPVLANRFLIDIAAAMNRNPPHLTPDGVRWLQIQSWQGNVRQLRNVMEIAVNFAEPGMEIRASDLRRWIAEPIVESPETLARVRERIESNHIRDVLRSCDFNLTRSAAVLGISRQALFKKMKSLSIIPPGR
ncbi:sigma 54-interacting transcriptional regulator, partial [bacterium]|nr:sigma 54-interacting transcriptional regulator [candidate division CSSED10-310 bacterium]